MSPEHSKRDYRLPEGAKSLIDRQPGQLPPIVGEMLIPEKASVRELASLLDQKPFMIIADLLHLGVLANVNQQLDFDTVSRLLRLYGYIAKKTV